MRTDNVADPRRDIAGQQTGFHALSSSRLAPCQCQRDGTSADEITQHSQRYFILVCFPSPATPTGRLRKGPAATCHPGSSPSTNPASALSCTTSPCASTRSLRGPSDTYARFNWKPMAVPARDVIRILSEHLLRHGGRFRTLPRLQGCLWGRPSGMLPSSSRPHTAGLWPDLRAGV